MDNEWNKPKKCEMDSSILNFYFKSVRVNDDIGIRLYEAEWKLKRVMS